MYGPPHHTHEPKRPTPVQPTYSELNPLIVPSTVEDAPYTCLVCIFVSLVFIVDPKDNGAAVGWLGGGGTTAGVSYTSMTPVSSVASTLQVWLAPTRAVVGT